MSTRARRIVTLLASGTEIVCKLGLSDQLVGISHECDYPTNILDRPRLTKTRVTIEASSRAIDDEVKAFSGGGQSLYEIDEATIASLQPDVIVTQSQCEVCAVNYADVMTMCRSNDALADTSLVPLNPTTLEGIYDDILRVSPQHGCEAAFAEATERRDVLLRWCWVAARERPIRSVRNNLASESRTGKGAPASPLILAPAALRASGRRKDERAGRGDAGAMSQG